MLDNNITLFSTQRKDVAATNESLVLTGCNAILYDNKYVYSELDELNFSSLNCNDYGCWRLDVEFCFQNTFNNSYFEFHAGCFSIRTNNGLTIKVHGNPNEKFYSKINKENKLVIGIRYYFRTEEEKTNIVNCNLFCIEGFIALNKKIIYMELCVD